MTGELCEGLFDYISDKAIGIICLDQHTRRPKYLDIPIKEFCDACLTVEITEPDDFMYWLFENKIAVRANKHSLFSYHKICGDLLECVRIDINRLT